MDTREHEIIRAFVELSNELVDGYDMTDLLARLTTNCADLLDIDAAGLLLADGHGVLHLVAASSEGTRHLEVLQLQRKEGPCLDTYRTGAPVVAPDLVAEADRWPQFCRAAAQIGFASVHALPMRLHDTVLGALGLFGATAGRLADDDLDLAQALAHVASVAIVNEKAAADSATVNAQLQHALTSRVVLEQAKGVLANVGGIGMDDAFTALRRYARDHGEKLTDVARRVVGRELDGQLVLDHAVGVGVLPHP
ncbi:GAF and ANTAR domain-containing protein [Oryzobacter telluris]|uniref:GAF and ANTAR domain-containing protein n=1 Tax=Oryzobacter telluris TaxID=3149179 RepID=UPI00370DCD5D